MQLLIVEDDYFIAGLIKQILAKHSFSEIRHVDNLSDAKKALELNPDICLLDIRLDGENGIDFAKILHTLDIPFMFITANNEIETIKEAAQTQPQAYLSKPIHEKDLVAAIEIIRGKTPKNIWIKTKEGQKKIRQNDILYLEADNVYVKVICENENFLIRKTLKEFEDELESFFVRIHRSFLVNKNKIEMYNGQELTIGSSRIPISKNYQSNLG